MRNAAKVNSSSFIQSLFAWRARSQPGYRTFDTPESKNSYRVAAHGGKVTPVLSTAKRAVALAALKRGGLLSVVLLGSASLYHAGIVTSVWEQAQHAISLSAVNAKDVPLGSCTGSVHVSGLGSVVSTIRNVLQGAAGTVAALAFLLVGGALAVVKNSPAPAFLGFVNAGMVYTLPTVFAAIVGC